MPPPLSHVWLRLGPLTLRGPVGPPGGASPCTAARQMESLRQAPARSDPALSDFSDAPSLRLKVRGFTQQGEGFNSPWLGSGLAQGGS